MRSKYGVVLFVLLAAILLSGCGTMKKVLNPYESSFACPNVDEGKCTDMQTAYQESIGQRPPEAAASVECGSDKCSAVGSDLKAGNTVSIADNEGYFKNRFQEKQYEIMAGMIEDPEAPIVVPPTVVRVLILSYASEENDMFGFRYAYFFGTNPKWAFTTAKEGGLR